MENLLLLVSPFLVSGLVSLIKRIPTVENLSYGPYVVVVRIIALGLSLAGAIGTFMLTGNLDESSVNVFVLALLNFLGSTGIHFLGKKK